MVLQLARKLTATVLGRDAADPGAQRALEDAGVPVASADCRTCADPCDEGHEEFPKRFDVDRESEMRGSVKPYRRQVLVSTGKADWAHDVTGVDNSLAKFIADADARLSRKGAAPPDAETSKPSDKAGNERAAAEGKTTAKGKGKGSRPSSKAPGAVDGVLSAASSGRLSVLNGSHTARTSDAADAEPDTHATVLVLPDYVAVTNVRVSADGAAALWRHALDPAVARAGTAGVPGMKTWPLPYACLILLCSHKKRDARCHIASKRLEVDFTHVLEAEGWAVDTDLDDLASTGPPLEDLAPTPAERAAAAQAQLHALSAAPESPDTQKKALILKNSHIGGHKFAGNVIIYFPQGLGVWYGRVSPHEVPAVVKHTILDGKVLAPLLRGGLNISRPGRSSLLEW